MIQNKLREVSQLNDKLTDTINETRALSLSIATKLKDTPKRTKKSFTTISKKLKSGVMILNNRGEVVHLNPAGEAIFKIKEDDVLEKPFTELLTTFELAHPKEKIELLPDLFYSLSQFIIKEITGSKEAKDKVCFDCIKSKFPSFFDLESENLIKVYSPCMGKHQTLKFSLSVLDNEPDEINDITYILIFRKYVATRHQR